VGEENPASTIPINSMHHMQNRNPTYPRSNLLFSLPVCIQIKVFS